MNIFRKIEDFEDYEVDNDGNVKSHITNKILKNSLNSCGYYHVCLSKDGKHFDKKIHRLVAEAFLPNPLGLPCVNHRDENRLNNHIELTLDSEGNVVVDYEKSNLEWCTYKHNNNWGSRNERMSKTQRKRMESEEIKAKYRNHPKMSKPVVAVKNGVVVMEFPSSMEAQRNGFLSSAINACCRNVTHHKTHKGYEWYFKSVWLAMQKENASPHKREDA